MNNVLVGKTVLVTGGTGSIGSGIVREALAQGVKKVVVFSRDEIKHFIMKRRIWDKRLETIVGDVRDFRSIEKVFRHDFDIIYHVAAMKHVVMCEDFPIEAVSTNIVGTQNVIDLAIEHRVPRMIAISTDKAAYPTNVMGATKFIEERQVLNANFAAAKGQVFSCVRFGNVANSRGSVIPIYVDNLLNGNPIEVTDPEVTRFIMKISDAVKLIFKATETARGGEIFIFKMKAFRLGDLADVIKERIAPRLKIDPRKIKIISNGLYPGEKLHEDLINSTESARLYSLDTMFVIIPKKGLEAIGPKFKKQKIGKYTSDEVELLSGDEIEELVLDYLEKRDVANGF